MKKSIKRAFTLLEMMVVLVIMVIVGGVVAISTRGSLDEARVFKTKEGIFKLYEVIELEVANGAKVSSKVKDIEALLIRSPLVRKPADLMQDGWKQELKFFIPEGETELRFSSAKYEAYCTEKGITAEYPWNPSKSVESVPSVESHETSSGG